MDDATGYTGRVDGQCQHNSSTCPGAGTGSGTIHFGHDTRFSPSVTVFFAAIIHDCNRFCIVIVVIIICTSILI
jgi:hypothetical protein